MSSPHGLRLIKRADTVRREQEWSSNPNEQPYGRKAHQKSESVRRERRGSSGQLEQPRGRKAQQTSFLGATYPAWVIGPAGAVAGA